MFNDDCLVNNQNNAGDRYESWHKNDKTTISDRWFEEIKNITTNRV